MSETVTIKVESVSEEQLPAIIKAEVAGLADFKQKKDEAKEKAEKAKQLAEQMQDPGFFKTNKAIKGVQDVARELTDAQVLSAEAQEKSFEYQEKLTAASKYLFQLGVTNMAMNRSVVRELRAALEGADPDELDELAQKEIENVISQLLAQEDLMNKQAKIAESIGDIEGKVSRHEKLLKEGMDKDDEQDRLLKLGQEKDKEQDRLLAEKAKIDEQQSSLLEAQKEKDIEHDEKLNKLEETIDKASERIKEVVPLKMYKLHITVLGSISGVALILAILALIIK